MAILMMVLFGLSIPKDAYGLTWQIPPVNFVPSPHSGGTRDISLAASPSGNAFSAYFDVSTNTLSVSRFSNALQTYEPPVTISSGDSVNVISVATDASETALLIWQDQTLNQILSSFFNGTSWITPLPTPLDSVPASFSAFPKVVMNGLGNGLAAWSRENGVTPPGDIVVSFFSGATQAWGPLQILNPLGTGGEDPVVAYSSNGTAVAVWIDGSSNLIASHFNGTSWSTIPVIVAANATLLTQSVQIDSAGTALVMWTDSVTGDAFASFFNGVNWEAPVDVSTVPTFGNVSFAMAPAGTAIAVWSDGTNGFYSQFIGGSWTAPIMFATNADNTSVAVDSSGNALIAWDDFSVDQSFSIFKPFGGALGTPDPINMTTTELSVRLTALSDNQRGFVDGFSNISEGEGFSGTFTLLPSPIVITAKTCKNKFVSQTDCVNIISWTPIADSAIVAYNLSKNGVLIAVIPVSGPFTFFDHYNCCKKVNTYSITPVDASGTEGPSATIVVK